MDAKGPLDDEVLGKSLNAASYEIADAIVHGSHVLAIEIPGALTVFDVDEYIPGCVLNLAVNAGWLPKPNELEPGQGEMLGDFIVDDAYQDWFVGLLADSLSDLRELALKKDDARAQQTKEAMFDTLLSAGLQQRLQELKGGLHDGQPASTPSESQVKGGGRGRELLAEYFRLSDDVFRDFELAQLVSCPRNK